MQFCKVGLRACLKTSVVLELSVFERYETLLPTNSSWCTTKMSTYFMGGVDLSKRYRFYSYY